MPLGFDDEESEENECPVCSGIIWGRGVKVMIEGAKLTVCSSCAQHGKKIKKTAPTYSSKKMGYKKPQVAQGRPPLHRKITTRIDDFEVVSDYAKIIRNARMARKLNQDQFAQKLNEKPSLIRRIETGKAEPTIKLAKKIEQIYKIKIIVTSILRKI